MVLGYKAECDSTMLIMATSRQPSLSRVGARIRGSMETARFYDDPTCQIFALGKIPVFEIFDAAARVEDEQMQPSFQDEVLKQLLKWFKKSFFQWVNSPKCAICNASTRHSGTTSPTRQEAAGLAHIVELHTCPNGHTTRFPRYNHPKTLLVTRKGRCGEWANAFCMCCKALGYDTRFVTDWTDHVWTECWSEARRRYIHLDACETAMDAPRMYESGWGKKLTYIFACSNGQCVDVTRKYTRKWDEVLSRRNLASEMDMSLLVAAIDTRARAQMEARVGYARRLAQMSDRRGAEVQEIQNVGSDRNEAALSEAERSGRKSGDRQWRATRGELGNQ